MYTLMIVDDEPNILEGLKCTLDWENYNITRIETAGSFSEAVARGIDCRPQLCIIDVCLGSEYGHDLIRKLREVGVESNFIMMSGYGEFRFACEAMRCGALDYLLKPIRAGKLEACVERVIVEKLHGALPSAEKDAQEKSPVLGVRYDSFSPLIGKVLLMVRAEYDQNITLKSIADRFRMNATYLGQLFIRETKLKFSEYLMIYRLNMARERILYTNDKIASIAADVGYTNINYFYTQFHGYYNMSPSEMRARPEESLKTSE